MRRRGLGGGSGSGGGGQGGGRADDGEDVSANLALLEAEHHNLPAAVLRMLLLQYNNDIDRVRERLRRENNPQESESAAGSAGGGGAAHAAAAQAADDGGGDHQRDADDRHALHYEVLVILLVGIFTHPFERVKCIQQTTGMPFFAACRAAISGGILLSALYRGFLAYVMRVVPDAVAARYLYDVVLRAITPERGWNDAAHGDSERVMLSAYFIASMICEIIFHPIRVVGVNVQATQGRMTPARLLGCCLWPYKQAGFWGYFTGLGCRLILGTISWWAAVFRPCDFQTLYRKWRQRRRQQQRAERLRLAGGDETLLAQLPNLEDWSRRSFMYHLDFGSYSPATPLVHALDTLCTLLYFHQKYPSAAVMFAEWWDGECDPAVFRGPLSLFNGYKAEFLSKFVAALIMSAVDWQYVLRRRKFVRFFNQVTAYVRRGVEAIKEPYQSWMINFEADA